MCITEDVKNSYKFPFGTEGREMLAGMNEHQDRKSTRLNSSHPSSSRMPSSA